MRYKVALKPRARKDLVCLQEQERERVVRAIKALEDNLSGDVKHLTNYSPEYRVRVGNWRVLFEIEGPTVTVYRILPRKDAYR